MGFSKLQRSHSVSEENHFFRVDKMKPMAQILTLAVVLTLSASALAENKFRQMSDTCQSKCSQVTGSWGRRFKNTEEIVSCEDLCDLIKVSVKVAVQGIEYATSDWLEGPTS